MNIFKKYMELCEIISDKLDGFFIKLGLAGTPRWAHEAIMLIPLIILINILSDGSCLRKENIFNLLFLYGGVWFLARTAFACTNWSAYSFGEILQPIAFLFVVGCILGTVTHFFPKYDINKDSHLSDEIMGADCEEAVWAVHISYEDKRPFRGIGLKLSHIVGNTELAKAQVPIKLRQFSTMYTNCTYTSHELKLEHLPRKYCQQHHYPLYLSFTNVWDHN